MNTDLRLIDSNEEFEKLESAWNDLLSRSPADNYFLTWEWLWNWWQIYARKDDELKILVRENDGVISCIAPFYVRKIYIDGIWPLRRMMFLGTQEDSEGEVCSEYMNIICDEGEERSLIEIIFRNIVYLDICDEIYVSKIDTSTATFDLFQREARKYRFLTMIENECLSPFVKLPPTWDEYLGSLSSSMRYKIRDERRKLAKCENVVVKTVASEAELERVFAELIRLHNQRWESKGLNGAFTNRQFVKFHRNMMPLMLHNGRLNLTCLSIDGLCKAVLYSMVYRNKLYLYQSGTDTTCKQLAFGYILHSYCLEEAIKRSLAEYDFLPKGCSDDYKDRFAKDCRTVVDLYMVCKWTTRQLLRARESVRDVYHNVKPLINRVREAMAQ